MREILFRGKRIDSGEWEYGGCVFTENKVCLIYNQTHSIDLQGFTVEENSVGQYTGLNDKTGKKIFEGDFVTLDGNGNYLVYEYNGVLCVDYETPDYDCTAIGFLKADCVEIEVIGNIHDNPELLEVKK